MGPGLLKRYGEALVEMGRLADCGLILLAGVISLRLTAEPLSVFYLGTGLVACVLFVIVASFNSLYRSWRYAPLAQEISVIVLSWFVAVALYVCCLFLLDILASVSRRSLLIWIILSPTLIVFLRLAIRPVLRMIRAIGRNYRKAAIIGANKAGSAVAKEIRNNPWMGIKVSGLWDDRHTAERLIADADTVGNVDDLVAKARNGEIDIVFITLEMSAENRIKAIVDAFANTTASVYLIPDIFMYGLVKSEVKEIGAIPVISVIDTPFQGLNWFLKRAEDIIVALVGIILTLVPMIFIALAIKLTSRGPIIFKQERHGEGGRPIMVYKFRTMKVGDRRAVFQQARVDDPRLTAIGGFLRRTSLDELPQFFNVLQGTMAVVGPRPHPTELNDAHRDRILNYMLRHKVKPGITGLAQVNGARGETESLDKMELRIRYDLEYIYSWSLLLDMKIIALTLFRFWRQREAY